MHTSVPLTDPDGNVIYVVLFPPQITLTIPGATLCVADSSGGTTCGYNQSFGTNIGPAAVFVAIPDFGSSCCNGFGGSAAAVTTGVMSHEITESFTDPGPDNAWFVKDAVCDNMGITQVADICEDQSSLTSAFGNFTVQREWSNRDSSCFSPAFGCQFAECNGICCDQGQDCISAQCVPHQFPCQPCGSDCCTGNLICYKATCESASQICDDQYQTCVQNCAGGGPNCLCICQDEQCRCENPQCPPSDCNATRQEALRTRLKFRKPKQVRSPKKPIRQVRPGGG